MTELARCFKSSLLEGRLRDIGSILEENWFLKKELSPGISNDKIDYYYDVARRNGATGGKLLGAGGTGFLMFYCEGDNREKLKNALKDLREYTFRFDQEGTKVILLE
jgi:D-glycero-alpha-D-manno-heptose-7-phosphate kinase